MLECKICGTKFNAIIERHYIARDNGKTGLAVEPKKVYMTHLIARCAAVR